MLPARFFPIAFGFVLSGLMSFLVSGIATYRNFGLTEDFLGSWIGAWLPSWLIAFPTVLVVAPIARRIVGRLIRREASVPVHQRAA